MKSEKILVETNIEDKRERSRNEGKCRNTMKREKNKLGKGL